jgi:hypothetical protein
MYRAAAARPFRIYLCTGPLQPDHFGYIYVPVRCSQPISDISMYQPAAARPFRIYLCTGPLQPDLSPYICIVRGEYFHKWVNLFDVNYVHVILLNGKEIRSRTNNLFVSSPHLTLPMSHVYKRDRSMAVSFSHNKQNVVTAPKRTVNATDKNVAEIYFFKFVPFVLLMLSPQRGQRILISVVFTPPSPSHHGSLWPLNVYS